MFRKSRIIAPGPGGAPSAESIKSDGRVPRLTSFVAIAALLLLASSAVAIAQYQGLDEHGEVPAAQVAEVSEPAAQEVEVPDMTNPSNTWLLDDNDYEAYLDEAADTFEAVDDEPPDVVPPAEWDSANEPANEFASRLLNLLPADTELLSAQALSPDAIPDSTAAEAQTTIRLLLPSGWEVTVVHQRLNQPIPISMITHGGEAEIEIQGDVTILRRSFEAPQVEQAMAVTGDGRMINITLMADRATAAEHESVPEFNRSVDLASFAIEVLNLVVESGDDVDG